MICTHARIPVMLVLLLTVTGLVLSGCKPQSLVSTSQEVEIGRDASQQVERQYRLDKDPAVNALVNQIGQTLVACSDRQDIKYTFKVLNVKDVNAFSLPGGWIYVNKGLIDATRGKSHELAGVIAHEIGHVAARHHAAMLGREIQAQILIGVLTKGDTRKIASIFADLQMLSWSREQEFEADKLGIKEMWRCRERDSRLYDPQGLIDFFAYLLTIEKRKPSEFEQIFRTHPVTQDRIKKAQKYLDDLRRGQESP